MRISSASRGSTTRCPRAGAPALASAPPTSAPRAPPSRRPRELGGGCALLGGVSVPDRPARASRQHGVEPPASPRRVTRPRREKAAHPAGSDQPSRPAGGASPFPMASPARGSRRSTRRSGSLWIAFSDRPLGALVPDPALRDELQTVKGAAFVLVTAALIFEPRPAEQARLGPFGAELRAPSTRWPDGVLWWTSQPGSWRPTGRPSPCWAPREGGAPGPAWSRAARGSSRADRRRAPRRRAYAATRVLAASGSPVRRVLRRRDGQRRVRVPGGGALSPGGARRSAISVLRDVSAAHRLDAHARRVPRHRRPRAQDAARGDQGLRPAHGAPRAGRAPALGVIQRQVDRLTRLVEHLLDSSRLRLDAAPAAPSVRPRRAGARGGRADAGGRPGPPLAVDGRRPVPVSPTGSGSSG